LTNVCLIPHGDCQHTDQIPKNIEAQEIGGAGIVGCLSLKATLTKDKGAGP
jgi:hypothetical protein